MSSAVLRRLVPAVLWALATAGTARPQALAVAPPQSQPPPAPFATLARQLATADEIARWEFADLTLAALAEAYASELRAAARESPASAEGRSKLARWRRGTAELLDSLQASRQRLSAGAAVDLRVDPRHQVLIIVGGQAVVVSGPRAETEAAIEQAVVERFCAFHDCGWLHAQHGEPGAVEPEPQGLWQLGQGELPRYEVDGRLQCMFTSLAERDLKAAGCRRTAEELRRLSSALQHAESLGHRIDWERLAVTAAPDARVVINADGVYLPLGLPFLAKLGAADWRRVIEWLGRDGPAEDLGLRITEADRLVDGPPGR